MFFRRGPEGKIVKPTNHSSVARVFQAEGTIERLPTGQHLFLIVRVEGLMWPKVEVVADESTWAAEVHEEGSPPNGEFSLSLCSVGREGYEKITAWLDRGESTGHYPGLRRIKDSVTLHSIALKLRPSSSR